MVASIPAKRTSLVSVTFLALLILTGCGSTEEASPLPIRILGNIPTTAYVGVEYYYEVGIDGGSGPLSYSLSNAPDWLETDLVDNNLRKAVVLRGIPGATGRDDVLTSSDTVILSVTDGDSIKTKEFGIEVDEVTISDVSGTVVEGVEGERPEDIVDSDGNGVLNAQDDTEPGTVCMSDSQGNYLFSEDELAYMLENQLNPDAWDGKKVQLEFIPISLDNGFYLDATGTFELESVVAEPDSDYLDTINLPGRGAVTVDSGHFFLPAEQTTCYILLFVVDDLVAEDDERFNINLEIDHVGELTAEVTATFGISIEDNEPIVSFSIPKISVSETTGRNIKVPVKVLLDRPPEQTVTAEFEVKTDVNGKAQIGGADDDLAITPSSFRVQFGVGIVEAKIEIEALSNVDDGDTDEYLTLRWVDTDTVRASDESELIVYVNEWLDDLRVELPTGGEVVESYADDKGDLYVGYRSVNADGDRVAHLRQFNRVRDLRPDESIGDSLAREITLELPDVDVELNDFVVDRYENTASDEIIEVYLLTTVNSSPAVADDEFEFGGTNILVQKYENVNSVGGFNLLWEKWVGTVQNDFARSISLDSSGNINVVGGTNGGFRGAANAGGIDGYVFKMNSSGEVTTFVQYGTSLNEYLQHVAQDGPSNFSTFAIIERSASGGGDNIIMRSLSTDGDLRRSAEIGSTSDEEIGAVNPGPVGAILAGSTKGNFTTLDTNQGGWDAIISYHHNLSEVTAAVQLGSSGDDKALDTKQVESQLYAGGYTTGDLFGDNLGGQDGWLVRYDIVDNEDTNDEEFEEIWNHHIGTSGDERLVKVVPTEFGKLFAIYEEEEGGATYLNIEALSIVDGEGMYSACRETPDGC